MTVYMADRSTDPKRTGRFDASLSVQDLRRALERAGRTDVAVECVDVTGSTNADLIARARRAAPVSPLLRAALEQTAGRGRFGRRWVAARGAALLFSVAVPVRSQDGALPAAVTLACGVAVAETLAARGAPVRLKWPNDVLLDGGKLAGILAELATDGDGARTLVVGAGVNLSIDAAARAAIDRAPRTNAAGHAATASLPPVGLDGCIDVDALAAGREALIGALAAAMLDAIERVAAAGFAPLRARYEALLAHAGRSVQLVDQGVPVAHGRLAGIDDEGRLLLASSDGVRAFSAGELSLRPTAMPGAIGEVRA